MQFLAELSGVSTELADLITRDLPFLSVSVASFDSGPLAPDAPLTSAGLLSNVLRGTGLAPTSVQIAESPDQRIFVLTDATTESEFISTDDIASLLFRHGAYEEAHCGSRSPSGSKFSNPSSKALASDGGSPRMKARPPRAHGVAKLAHIENSSDRL